MEIIIALERMYGLIGYGVTHQKSDNTPIIKNAKLRDAVLYIESRFDGTGFQTEKSLAVCCRGG